VFPLPSGERARVRGNVATEADTARPPTPRDRARQLRREQTDAERKLWALLRDRQVFAAKFRRQHPIGSFITDFCRPERSLVIELDGGEHASTIAVDARRTASLEGRGYRVLRFWNHDVLRDPEAVLERIALALAEPAVARDPHPNPLPGRERG
jgi:very-short-patch-repair endonuclease